MDDHHMSTHVLQTACNLLLPFWGGSQPLTPEVLIKLLGWHPRECDPLLTVTRTCALTGLSRSTLYRRLKDGTIPSIRVGGCRRIPASGIRALTERECPEGQPGGSV